MSPRHRTPGCRRGFALSELLVAGVVGGLLLLATYQVLATHSRTQALNASESLGREALRAGMEAVFQELREISPEGGDLRRMAEGSLTVRTPGKFGVVCQLPAYGVGAPSGAPGIRVVTLGTAFETGDSVLVLAENDPGREGDDRWLARRVQAVEEGESCFGEPAQILVLPDLDDTGLDDGGDVVRPGAVVRGFRTVTYGLFQVRGQSFLARQLPGASGPDPVAGPLLPSGGVEFEYLDAMGAPTRVDTSVAQVQLTLRFQSSSGDPESGSDPDSLVARVVPRNTP